MLPESVRATAWAKLCIRLSRICRWRGNSLGAQPFHTCNSNVDDTHASTKATAEVCIGDNFISTNVVNSYVYLDSRKRETELQYVCGDEHFHYLIELHSTHIILVGNGRLPLHSSRKETICSGCRCHRTLSFG